MTQISENTMRIELHKDGHSEFVFDGPRGGVHRFVLAPGVAYGGLEPDGSYSWSTKDLQTAVDREMLVEIAPTELDKLEARHRKERQELLEKLKEDPDA